MVKTAVESAKTTETVVIANDTDIIVLLWCHVNEKYHDVSVQDDKKRWDVTG